MVKETSDILELVIKVFTLIGGLVAAYIFIKKWHKSYVAKMNSFFSGAWSNEGVIGGINPSHYIDMSINCSKDELSGFFNVRKLDEDHTWHSVNIHGKRTFSTTKCRIYQVKDGHEFLYGRVILKKNSKKFLRWKITNGVADFFPKETTLFRSLPVIF